MEKIDTPKRALLVIPHPDDGESGCGGTIAKWASEGCEVLYVVCTNGDKGSSDPEMTSERLAAIREIEQRNAASILGVSEIVFLRHGDGELEDDHVLRGEVVREIRRFKPDVVMAIDPHRIESHTHRDHRISGQVALDAVFPYSRDRLHYVEHERMGLSCHKTGTVLLWSSERPTVAVDVSETVDLKMKALLAHVCQMGEGVKDPEGFSKRWKERAAERAKETGFQYAETFRKLTFRI